MSHTKKIHFEWSKERPSKCNSFTYRNMRVTNELKMVTCRRCIAQVNGSNGRKAYARSLNRKLDGLREYMSKYYNGWNSPFASKSAGGKRQKGLDGKQE